MKRRGTKKAAMPLKRVRCAVYCRKSHQEGLDQEFNSLDAQREAADAYIRSQKHAGWAVLPERYDDGGFSGGTIDRPALQRLLQDVELGRVDCIVVYKVDRLSRSLLDFVKIVEILDERNVSFVSVTQHFNTTTSMGRLTLNVLLSFAQFEREQVGERIRDKIAMHKRRGKHTGGPPVLGYDVVDKRLVVNKEEAQLVQRIFQRFRDLGSPSAVAAELNDQGYTTKCWTTAKGKAMGGNEWSKAQVYAVLNRGTYLGFVEHKGEFYEGEHEAIIPRKLWDGVQRVLAENCTSRANHTRAETPALLKGLIRCGHCGSSMGPTFTKKAGRTYIYYLCTHAKSTRYDSCPVRSVAAGEVEEAVVDQLRAVFRTPELIARTYREAKSRESEEISRLRKEQSKLSKKTDQNGNADVQHRLETVTDELRFLETHAITESEVIDALEQLDPLWEELFPAEQARIVQLLVERVEVQADGLELRLRSDGLRSLVAELTPGPEKEATG